MIDLFFHRLLRLPYTLHAQASEPSVKPRATVLFLHGIGHSGEVWTDSIAVLPEDIRYVTIDLLGFGKSPQPSWALYSAKTQARSIYATLLKLQIRGPLIVVGHSLGSLVAVELAKRHPRLVKSLILCSPPFYKADRPFNRDKLLKDIYRFSQKHPERFLALTNRAKQYGLVNQTFNVSGETIAPYMNALEATIINQDSLEDAKKLRVPTTILHGKLDPVVIPRNLKELATTNPHIELIHLLAGHEIRGRFIPALHMAIERHVKL